MLSVLTLLFTLAVEFLERFLLVLFVPQACLVMSPGWKVIVDRHIAVLAGPSFAGNPHVGHVCKTPSFDAAQHRETKALIEAMLSVVTMAAEAEDVMVNAE